VTRILGRSAEGCNKKITVFVLSLTICAKHRNLPLFCRNNIQLLVKFSRHLLSLDWVFTISFFGGWLFSRPLFLLIMQNSSRLLIYCPVFSIDSRFLFVDIGLFVQKRHHRVSDE